MISMKKLGPICCLMRLKYPQMRTLDWIFSIQKSKLSTEENPISDNDPIEPSSPSFDLIKSMKGCFTHDSSNRLTPPISSKEEDNKENEL